MFIRVALPVPQLGLLTYRVPEGLPRPAIGARVVVPLGSRMVTGIVVDDDTPTDLADSAVKPIRDVLDSEAFVPGDVIALAAWTAEYYAAGAGEALTAVLPPKARGSRVDGHKTLRVAAITAAGLGALEERGRDSTPVPFSLTAKQRDVLELLAGSPTGLPTPELAARGFAADTIARLARQALVSLRQDRVNRDPFTPQAFEVPAADAD